MGSVGRIEEPRYWKIEKLGKYRGDGHCMADVKVGELHDYITSDINQMMSADVFEKIIYGIYRIEKLHWLETVVLKAFNKDGTEIDIFTGKPAEYVSCSECAHLFSKDGALATCSHENPCAHFSSADYDKKMLKGVRYHYQKK